MLFKQNGLSENGRQHHDLWWQGISTLTFYEYSDRYTTWKVLFNKSIMTKMRRNEQERRRFAVALIEIEERVHEEKRDPNWMCVWHIKGTYASGSSHSNETIMNDKKMRERMTTRNYTSKTGMTRRNSKLKCCERKGLKSRVERAKNITDRLFHPHLRQHL